ncbi:hypothetical protein JQ580_24925 [Bradyrhizobium japonicum]|uniref:hypothetical protein n=1 Tax=Bradyrhizobium japonicum TaxID=375 RepID=UPI001BADD967|nr:hypothetical protein [Bradyrhizobium japonicum]MBR0993969.1 hypothetical protein [Bradyrhizobium japonicum]
MPIDRIHTINITGRDGAVVRKALAYAIEAIDRLPRCFQESSDREDMLNFLDVLGDADLHQFVARQHLVASLANPDEDDADFIEDGSTPTPDEAEFIDEEEDENLSGVVR